MKVLESLSPEERFRCLQTTPKKAVGSTAANTAHTPNRAAGRENRTASPRSAEPPHGVPSGSATGTHAGRSWNPKNRHAKKSQLRPAIRPSLANFFAPPKSQKSGTTQPPLIIFNYLKKSLHLLDGRPGQGKGCWLAWLAGSPSMGPLQLKPMTWAGTLGPGGEVPSFRKAPRWLDPEG